MHRLLLWVFWYGRATFAVLPSPFVATTDSSFQNTYEYLAILLGLLLTKTLGLRNCVFAVLGDSRSSLAWVLKGRARSTLCRRASIGFSVLAVNVAATIYESHLKRMWRVMGYPEGFTLPSWGWMKGCGSAFRRQAR